MKLLRSCLRRTPGLVLGGAVLGLAFAPSLRAQDSLWAHADTTPRRATPTPYTKAPPKKVTTFEIWSAGARNAPLKTRYGLKRDRELYLMGLRWSRPIGRHAGGVWEYTNDVLPMVAATQTPFYRDTTFTRRLRIPSRSGIGQETVTQRVDSMILFNRTVYGAGWVPLGLRYRTETRYAQLVLGLSAGAVYFNRRMPDPEETQFNFTLDGTAVLDIPLGKHHGVSLGYRFNHISNANTGRVNPGMNSSMLQLGWSVRRGS